MSITRKTAKLVAAVLLASATMAPASQAAPQQPGPKKCYQSYLKNLYYAKDLKEVSPYWSTKRSALWNGLKQPAKQKKLDYLRSVSYVGGKYQVVSEKIEGDNAHLVLKGVNVNSNKTRVQALVEANMVREDGFWKISDATTKYVGNSLVATKLK